jgi:hypothetical protein
MCLASLRIVSNLLSRNIPEDLMPTVDQIKSFKAYFARKNGNTNSVYLALPKLKSIPRNPPDEMNKSILVNFVEGRDGIIVGDGSEGSLFMAGFTTRRLLSKLILAAELSLRGKHLVLHLDATFKLNVNVFPIVVSNSIVVRSLRILDTISLRYKPNYASNSTLYCFKHSQQYGSKVPETSL